MSLKRALVSSLALACLTLVALKSPQSAKATDARGVFVRIAGKPRRPSSPGPARRRSRLTSTGSARPVGEVVFAAGDYELETGFRITRARDLRIAGSGAGTTRLHFAPEPTVRPTLIEDARIWSKTLRVADAGSMREGRGYQLYKADLKGDRILEFVVDRIEGDTPTLRAPIHFMGHVKEIPAGSVVIDEINAFALRSCERVTIESLEIDGATAATSTVTRPTAVSTPSASTGPASSPNRRGSSYAAATSTASRGAGCASIR